MASVFPEPLSPLKRREGTRPALSPAEQETQGGCAHPKPPSPVAPISAEAGPGWWQHGASHVAPDDDTLVVFGIHHFGVGDVCDGKEVPGVGGKRCHVTPAKGPASHPDHPQARTRSLQHPATEARQGCGTSRVLL